MLTVTGLTDEDDQVLPSPTYHFLFLLSCEDEREQSRQYLDSC